MVFSRQKKKKKKESSVSNFFSSFRFGTFERLADAGSVCELAYVSEPCVSSCVGASADPQVRRLRAERVPLSSPGAAPGGSGSGGAGTPSSWRSSSDSPEDELTSASLSPPPSLLACGPASASCSDSELSFTIGVTEATPYACHFCDKAFPRLSYLKRHEQVGVLFSQPPVGTPVRFGPWLTRTAQRRGRSARVYFLRAFAKLRGHGTVTAISLRSSATLALWGWIPTFSLGSCRFISVHNLLSFQLKSTL